MEEFQLGGEPQIRLERIHGDIRISGGHENGIRIAGEYHTRIDGNTLFIQSDDDVRLEIPSGAVVTAASIDGDLEASQFVRLTVETVNGDVVCRHVSEFKAHTINGDAKLDHVDAAEITQVNGDVKAINVQRLRSDQVAGDVSISTSSDVIINAIHGDLKGRELTGSFSSRSVSGDVSLQGALSSLPTLEVGGDLLLDLAWNENSDYRATVGGDARLMVAPETNLVLSATVHGDADDFVHTEGGTVSQTWGNPDTAARVELTVHGDLRVNNGHAKERHRNFGESWSAGFGGNWQEAINEIVDELTTMGRDIAKQFTNIDWNRYSSDRADRARRAAERATERATRAAERLRVKINDREFRFDPERLERIREQAQRAAEEGIGRAQEAVERAVSGLERAMGGFGRPPMPPTPPTPPMHGRPPMPPRPIGPQRFRVSESDGSATTEGAKVTAEQVQPTTGPTVSLDPETLANAQEAAPKAANLTEERLAILKMVAAGKISADEAAMLLEALG